jgi:hypothetical protein
MREKESAAEPKSTPKFTVTFRTLTDFVCFWSVEKKKKIVW